MSLTMTDTEVSTKLLTIFEALISSCSQQYQLLCEEDQLKANKIFKKTFITCFEIKSEDPVKEEEVEYFEQDDAVVSELKVKDQLEMTLNVGNSETQELDDAEIFQELDFNCPDTDSSSENVIEEQKGLKRPHEDAYNSTNKKARVDTSPEYSVDMVPAQNVLSSHLQTIVKTIVKSTMEEGAVRLFRSKSEEPDLLGSKPLIGRRSSWAGTQTGISHDETNLQASHVQPILSTDEPWYQDIGCEKLTLTTSGPSVSAEFFGSCIGRFVPMENTPNCFIQKHSKSGRKLILMRTPLTAFKRWLWTVRFEKDYMPVFQNVSESPQVPRKDWQWWDLKLSLWKYDTSLTMEAFSPCGTITITVRGPATEILPEKSVFKPKQGEWFSGRQVFCSDLQAVLIVAEGTSCWSIQGCHWNYTWIRSASATNCPADPKAGSSSKDSNLSWQFNPAFLVRPSPGSWREADISITCSKHHHREEDLHEETLDV